MKKEVKYYLEDLSRLKEISQSELDEWITEMPFHQPLHMLAGLKLEMDGHNSDESNKVHAAYFAEDYELASKTKSKKGKKKDNIAIETISELNETVDKIETPIQSTQLNEELTASSLIANADHINDTENQNENIAEVSIENIGIGAVTSELANETLEDEVINELLEENIDKDNPPKIELRNENDLADETLEDEVINELLEENLDQDDSELLIVEEEDLSKGGRISEVDYSEFIDQNLEAQDVTSSEERHEFETLKLINGKKKKKKEKSKKKKKGDKKEKKKGKKSEKKKDEKKKKKSKKNKVKNLTKLAIPKKKSKTKKKKKSRKVEYVIIDSQKEKDFKLQDYDGVSNYTSWLLEQESINGKDEKLKKAKPLMKKSIKKKKKKKSKKLKIAVDSIKKQDSIISEPLARILALQGHKKKARKMYAKLAKAFPDKKGYFDEKAEALNSKEK